MDISPVASIDALNDPENVQRTLDQEIIRLRMAISDIQTRRDTIAPMAHLFNRNVFKELENEMRGTEILLQHRRARRNTLARISLFPDQILVNIFMYAREFTGVKVDNRPTPQLAVCSYVSRHWRMLVLASPFLWNNINLDWPHRWVEAWFARSQSATLDITMHSFLKRQSFPSITQLLSANSFRLRRMQVSMAEVEEWMVHLQYPTPLLEFIEIHVHKADPSQLIFPQAFLGGRPLPLLRTFGYYGQHNIWSSPLLLNLTSLKVDQYVHRQRPSIKLRHILRALQRMRQLEHIHLEGEVFPDDRENPDQSVVELPWMQSIHLRGAAARICVLIDHLVMPTTVSMALYATTSLDSLEAMHIFIQYLRSHFDAVRLTPAAIVKFNRVTALQRKENVKIWVDHPDTGSVFTLQIPLASMLEHTMRNLCNVLPLDQSKILCVHADQTSRELWFAMLAKMQALEVLDMGRFASRQFAYAMANSGTLWPLLSVHTLGLCSVDFGLAVRDDPTLFEALCNCLVRLRERQNLWMPDSGLKMVEVYQCTGVNEEFLKALRDAGIDVRVDDNRDDGIARRARRIR